MTIEIEVTKFSMEGLSLRKQISEFKKSICENNFIEIVDCSQEEAMKLIIAYIKDEYNNARVLHIGDRDTYDSFFPQERINTVAFSKEMASEENIINALRMRPDVFLIRHNFINYMERDYFKKLNILGHTVIFY